MIIRTIAIGVIVPLLAACQTVPLPPPPVIEVLFKQKNSREAFITQGIIVQDRVLTCKHGSWEEPQKEPFPPSTISLLDAPFEVVGSLDDPAYVDCSIEDSRWFSMFLSDWLALRVGDAPVVKFDQKSTGFGRWYIGPGLIRPGETMYAFRPFRVGDEFRYSAVQLQSPERKYKWKEEPPPMTYHLLYKSDRDPHGWSGSFVCRFDRPRNAWELIGLMNGAANSSLGPVAVVTRPPIHILDWLARGDASGVTLTSLRIYPPRTMTPEEIAALQANLPNSQGTSPNASGGKPERQN